MLDLSIDNLSILLVLTDPFYLDLRMILKRSSDGNVELQNPTCGKIKWKTCTWFAKCTVSCLATLSITCVQFAILVCRAYCQCSSASHVNLSTVPPVNPPCVGGNPGLPHREGVGEVQEGGQAVVVVH